MCLSRSCVLYTYLFICVLYAWKCGDSDEDICMNVYYFICNNYKCICVNVTWLSLWLERRSKRENDREYIRLHFVVAFYLLFNALSQFYTFTSHLALEFAYISFYIFNVFIFLYLFMYLSIHLAILYLSAHVYFCLSF